MVRIAWTPDADARLLLAILAECPVKIDYQKVAERFGQGATQRAIGERIFKLKTKANLNSCGSGDDNDNSTIVSAPNTPKKRKSQKVMEGGVTKSPAKKRGGKVKKERIETETEEDEDFE